MLFELLLHNKCQLENRYSYMMPHLDKLICLVKMLERNAGPLYFEAFHERELRKGKYLLQEGEACKQRWFLKRGLARIFGHKDGMEVTKYFYTPGECIHAYCCYFQQIPSNLSVQLLEDSVVLSISNFTLERLALIYPAIHEIEKLLLQSYTIWSDQRNLSLQHSNATEQYLIFLHQHAPILERLTVTNIASYMAVPIETVSRIKKRIERNCQTRHT